MTEFPSFNEWWAEIGSKDEGIVSPRVLANSAWEYSATHPAEAQQMSEAAAPAGAAVPAPIGIVEACHAAVAAIYFDDSSDYESALRTVVRYLATGLSADLERNPKAAFDNSMKRVEAESKAVSPAAPAPSNRGGEREAIAIIRRLIAAYERVEGAWNGSGSEMSDATDAQESAISTARSYLASALAKSEPKRQSEGESGWKPITAPGQVSIGDKLIFTIGDDVHTETVKAILDHGTGREELIYNKSRNFYLITSMCMENKGSRKNVLFLRTGESA